MLTNNNSLKALYKYNLIYLIFFNVGMQFSFLETSPIMCCILTYMHLIGLDCHRQKHLNVKVFF
jgi:hypothetical protein